MSLVAAPVVGTSPRSDVARSHADGRAVASAVAWAGVCGLVLVAPFEALRPLVHLPGQSLSTVETALVVGLAAWAVSLVACRVLPVWRTSLTLPWLAFIVSMSVAAFAAPEYRANAFRMVGRLGLAFSVYLLTINAIDSKARLVKTLIAASIAAAMVWPLIVFEYTGVAAVTDWLTTFRTHVANVGGHVRASGPFQYPTIASMYLEVLFALALGLLLICIDSNKPWRAVTVGVLLVAIGQAITFTYTRAGFAAMLAGMLIVAVVRRRPRRFDPAVKALLAVAILIGIQLPGTRSFDALGLRLTTEGQADWYRASFDVPVDITVSTGAIITVPVHVTNTGRTDWNPLATPRFRLSYHWLLEDNHVVSWQGLRTDFPHHIASGEGVLLQARVEAPMQPGRYRLMWDIERENWLWFSSEPGAAMFVSNATVTGPQVGPLGSITEVPLPQATSRPGRLVLWRAALAMFFDHPITGVGPDNFRLVYGRYVGLVNFDDRVHSNNMYLEMLAGGGILGAVAFGWLCWAAVMQIGATLSAASDKRVAAAAAGIAAASVAIALHGLVDSFLSFTATYILIAVTLGLTTAALAVQKQPQNTRNSQNQFAGSALRLMLRASRAQSRDANSAVRDAFYAHRI